MASADICSSATTPRVYASTTQSICASDSTPAVPLGPDHVHRGEPAHPLARRRRSALGRSPSSHRSADGRSLAPRHSRDLRGGSPSPAQYSRAVGVDHHDPGRAGPAPGHRAPASGQLGASSRIHARLGRPRRSPAAAPSSRSRPAGRRTMSGCTKTVPPPRHAASRVGHRRAPASARRPPPGPPRRTRAAAARPSAAGRGTASTRQSGPPCSHSNCRHRPHGISGSPVRVDAGQRHQPAAAAGVQRRHQRRTRRTAPTPYEAFSTLQPTTTRPSSTSAGRADRKRRVRRVRVPHRLDRGGPQRAPSRCPCRPFCPSSSGQKPAGHAAGQNRHLAHAARLRLTAQPLMYGLPSAAGARTRPTSPATARIVAR